MKTKTVRLRMYDPEAPGLLVTFTTKVDAKLTDAQAKGVAKRRYRLKRLLEDVTVAHYYGELERKMRKDEKLLKRFNHVFLELPPRSFVLAYRSLAKMLAKAKERREGKNRRIPPPYPLSLEDADYDHEYPALDAQRACFHALVRLCLYDPPVAANVEYLIDKAIEQAPPDMRARYAA